MAQRTGDAVDLQDAEERARTHEWFKLSKRSINFLFVYLAAMFLIGLWLSCSVLFGDPAKLIVLGSFDSRGFVAGIGMSFSGCGVFYLRKLYKSSIKNLISVPSNADEQIRSTGVFYYFFLRPWFSAIFTFIAYVVIRQGVHSITTKTVEFEIGFVYLMLILGFLIGFATGDVITYFETRASDLATRKFFSE